MKLVQSFLLAAAFTLVGWTATESIGEPRATADQIGQSVEAGHIGLSSTIVVGEGRLILHDEAQHVLKRYRSIPGTSVTGEGGLITHGEAHKVLKRYRSIPGTSVTGEGGLITHGEADKVLKRYRSIPGASVTGEGGLITHGEADKVLKRYRSIPGASVTGEGGLITHGEAHKVLKRYRSIPGGLILEGKAIGVDDVKAVRYEPASNAFVLNDDRVIYLSPIPAPSAALLARAIARDDRVGVSLGEESDIVFGRLPRNSILAADLRLADNFLGDIIIPPQEWTTGYLFANGFEPRQEVGTDKVVVFFRFREFHFALNEGNLALARAQFDVRVVPTVDKEAANGGYLPDYEAISAAAGFEQFEIGASHVADNIGYYLGEEIVRRSLAYGEVAAFFRSLKAARVNLRKLALSIDASMRKPASRRPTAGTLADNWLNYLREIQESNRYANWSAPPYDLYLTRQLPGTKP
jgi:hypothetical protein